MNTYILKFSNRLTFLEFREVELKARSEDAAIRTARSWVANEYNILESNVVLMSVSIKNE